MMIVASNAFLMQMKKIHDEFFRDFLRSNFSLWIGFNTNENHPFIGILENTDNIDGNNLIPLFDLRVFFSKSHLPAFQGIILYEFENGEFFAKEIKKIEVGHFVLHKTAELSEDNRVAADRVDK